MPSGATPWIDLRRSDPDVRRLPPSIAPGRPIATDVVGLLLEEETARPQAVAEELDVARSTLEWHLGGLVEHDVVGKRRDAENRATLELARPGETVRLLREADPALLDRLVDRFSRLLDRLLAE